MQGFNKITTFLTSMTVVSPTHYQIWDSKGNMVFSTDHRETDFLTTSTHMKMAKKVILSDSFTYMSLDHNGFICGIPMEMEHQAQGALLALGPRPDLAGAGEHPDKINAFLEQILDFAQNGTSKVQAPSQNLPDQLDHNFEDLYLFANISKQFRSLRFKQPVLGKLMHRMLDHMDADAAFLELSEKEHYNLLEIRPGLLERGGESNVLRDQFQQIVSSSVRNCKGNYCIVNNSFDDSDFKGLSDRPFGLLAAAVRHLKTTYGWLGLVSYDPLEEFKPETLNIVQTLANQLAAMMANMEQHDDLERFTVNIVCSLVNAIEAKDAFVRGHSKRVHQYAMQMANNLNLSAEEVDALKWAAVLHDIGKIGIPERILCKPGKLTEKEFDLIKQHPGKGKTILAPIRQLAPSMEAIAHHHESYNGSGYPDGLKGEQIPLGARILAVADTFDALTSKRSYHEPKNHLEALLVMEQVAGIQLDPMLVKTFKKAFMESMKDKPVNKTAPIESGAPSKVA